MNVASGWSLGRKLGTCIGTMVMFLLILAGYSKWTITSLGDSEQLVINGLGKKVDLAGLMDAGAERMRTDMRSLVLAAFTKDQGQTEQTRADFEATARSFREALDAARALIDGDTERQVDEKLRKDLEGIQGAFHRIDELCAAGKAREADKLRLELAEPISKDADEVTDRLRNEQLEDLAAAAKSAADSLSRSRTIGIALITMCLLVSLAVFFVIRTVTANLRSVADQMLEQAEQVASASSQVSAASQSLAEGATEQAASLEQSSASTEQIHATARRNSDNSRRAAQVVDHSTETVHRANSVLEQMKTAMGAIGASSREISHIIKVIDEIAFQTNILALNASVEAARAGEAGLGFAVVADEVRNLAQRCADAAKQTTSQIEDSLSRSAEGMATMNRVTDAIRAITSDADNLESLVRQVNTASVEQSEGIQQVAKAISQMQAVTQEAAAHAEESAAVSEQLYSQSNDMRDSAQALLAIVAGGDQSARPVRTQTEAAGEMPGDMFAWNPRYAIGVEAIDAQHKKLFEMTGELYAAMIAGRGRAVLKGLLRNLIEYTENHFHYEEGLMQRCGYSDFAAHKARHDDLTSKVREFEAQFASGRSAISQELLVFLRDWLYQHILKSDTRYAPHVQDARMVAGR